MLAKGISSPAPLDELESHLREEIEQQLKSGANELVAYQAAAQHIGRSELLQSEFKRAAGFGGWLGGNQAAGIHRALGLFWAINCAVHLALIVPSFLALSRIAGFNFTVFFLVALVFEGIYLRGLIGSILWFRGINRDRRIIRMIAALQLLETMVMVMIFPQGLLVTGGIFIFSAATIYLLRPPVAAAVVAG